MTERGLPSVEGSPACPFVAFDDDRDERADRPDHRHRCYAESPPAPRALAHQEAYCLSSAFPVCPIFQDWARRESARARSAGETTAGSDGSAAAAATASGYAASSVREGDAADEWRGAPEPPQQPIEMTPRRNPPRDWAAPPPWASGAGAAAGAAAMGPDAEPPDFLGSKRAPTEGQGLAGSAADRLASSGTLHDGSASVRATPGASVRGDEYAPQDRATPSSGPDAELADLVAAGAAAAAFGTAGPVSGAGADDPGDDPSVTADGGERYPPSTRTGKRPTVSSSRPVDPARDRERERDKAAAAERGAGHGGPSWERSRRFEAYPTIKTRAGVPGMPGLPRVAVLAGALGIAAVALFFLPALFGLGSGSPSASSSPSPTTAATVEPSPTPVPAPTPQSYTIKEGDTLSKIAKKFDITIDELLEANKDTIEDADKISIGDVIVIPVAVPDEVDEETPEP